MQKRDDLPLLQEAETTTHTDHFRRVIRNLLDNAARYAQHAIVISLTTEPTHIVLMIEDEALEFGC
jgi:signal transduction histidine kinase